MSVLDTATRHIASISLIVGSTRVETPTSLAKDKVRIVGVLQASEISYKAAQVTPTSKIELVDYDAGSFSG